MRVFGLTGGIASGKSEVARFFRRCNVPVVDADELAREVVAPGTPGLFELVGEFGPGILQTDGSLDRKALADIVFRDPEKRARLNALTHVRIAAASSERFRTLAERGEPVACYEAALLIENGMVEAFRPLVVVHAPKEVRLRRALARDQGEPDEVLRRMEAQVDDEARTRSADFVIENIEDLAALERRSRVVLAQLLERLQIPRERYGLASSA